MSMSNVRSKRESYSRLIRGDFGNTVPVWFDLDVWEREGRGLMPTWGVRSMTAGGPCRLHTPADQVRATADAFLATGHVPNVSPMISNVATATLAVDVWDAPGGLTVTGAEHPAREFNWREMMKRPAAWRGLAARHVLSRHLNPSSLADLYAVLDRFPGHVVELSALPVCYGTVPGRNAVVWEVRDY